MRVLPSIVPSVLMHPQGEYPRPVMAEDMLRARYPFSRVEALLEVTRTWP